MYRYDGKTGTFYYSPDGKSNWTTVPKDKVPSHISAKASAPPTPTTPSSSGGGGSPTPAPASAPSGPNTTQPFRLSSPDPSLPKPADPSVRQIANAAGAGPVVGGAGMMAGAEGGAELGAAFPILGPATPFVGSVIGSMTGAALGEEGQAKIEGRKADPAYAATQAGLSETTLGAFKLGAKPIVDAGKNAVRTVEGMTKDVMSGDVPQVEEGASKVVENAHKMLTHAANAVRMAKEKAEEIYTKAFGEGTKASYYKSILDLTSFPPPADPTGQQAAATARVYQTAASQVRSIEGKGREIGQVYEKAVKGKPESADLALNLQQQDLQAIRGELQSNAPKTNAYISELSKYGRGKKGEIVPIKPEKLLRFRQNIERDYRAASGAEKFGLGRLMDKLDESLDSYIPQETIGPLRTAYKNQLRVVPYSGDITVSKASNPAKVAEVVFDKPERAKAILSHVNNPADFDMLRSAFKQHVFAGLNPMAPADQQIKSIEQGLEPYMANGVVEKLFGKEAGQELANIKYMPYNVERMARTMQGDPHYQEMMMKEISRQLQSKNGQQAAQYANEALKTMGLFPNAESINKAAVVERLKRGFINSSAFGRFQKYAENRELFYLLAGSYGEMSHQNPYLTGAIFSGMLWRGAMKHGGAELLADFYASPNAREAGVRFYHLLAAIGASEARSNPQPQGEEHVETR